ncbi:MAG: UDP-N-acetylmuramoyl-L-alanine--D-glutamate ligase [Coxiella sp. (in: Bacteria)]|nr:MAG: UDP-N-acetylmuramoyl-L-alanine--D-glutamate ligase [Coxiella sp. (in: g-proteobacteria)]
MNVVIGLGKTGISCVDYFQRQGKPVTLLDTRDDPPGLAAFQTTYPDVPVITGQLPAALLLATDEIVVSPGISLQTPALASAIEQGVACIGDIELFAREATAPIVAITGSNGKTTLTHMVAQMVRDAGLTAEVCGNVGVPVLDLLKDKTPDVYVMELSSFQLETTFSLKPNVAVVLNVSPDHMDRYASVAAYRAAKQRVYRGCHFAILNADEPEIWQQGVLPESPSNQLLISTRHVLADGFSISPDNRVCLDAKPWVATSEFAYHGGHHNQNTLAALAIGHCLGLTKDTMLASLKAFKGLHHRCEKIATLDGVDWYNDSKATNVGAVVAALNSLGPRYSDIILIAGGDAKQADLSGLQPVLKQYVSRLIVIGAAADELQILFGEVVSTHYACGLEAAVHEARQCATMGSAVILSPACASWDMFESYEQRGNLFKEAVQELIDEQGNATQT